MPLPVVPLAVSAVLYGAVNTRHKSRSKGRTGKKKRSRGKGPMGSLGSVGSRKRKQAAAETLPVAESAPLAPPLEQRVVRRQPVTNGSARRSTFPYKEALKTWEGAPWQVRVKELTDEPDEHTPTEIAAIVASDLWDDHKWPAQTGGGQRAMWRRVLRDVHTELGVEPPRSARAVRPVPQAAETETDKTAQVPPETQATGAPNSEAKAADAG